MDFIIALRIHGFALRIRSESKRIYKGESMEIQKRDSANSELADSQKRIRIYEAMCFNANFGESVLVDKRTRIS